FAIGHGFQPVLIAADARKFFDMRVPRRYIVVTDWPVDGIAVALRGGKLKITPPLAGASPHDRFAAHLVAAYPIERLFLDVGVLFVLHKKMVRVLAKSIALADHRVFLDHL